MASRVEQNRAISIKDVLVSRKRRDLQFSWDKGRSDVVVLFYNFFLSSLQNSEYGVKFCPTNTDNMTVTCCFVTRAHRKPV